MSKGVFGQTLFVCPAGLVGIDFTYQRAFVQMSSILRSHVPHLLDLLAVAKRYMAFG